MSALLRPAITLFVLLTILTGGIYPALVTALAKLGFAHQAGGSVIVKDGQSIGSELIAQPFTDPRYFWSRPSAANYEAAASYGSNLAQDNPALTDAVASRIKQIQATGIEPTTPIPVDQVTTSASGLDPHISVAAARIQIARIAAARHISADEVNKLLEQTTEDRALGIFGEPRVNVLLLNLEMDHKINPPVTADINVVGWRGRAFLPESEHH